MLPTGPQLDRFVNAASVAGLTPADAVRLALERELALRDVEACGVGREAGRYLLDIRTRTARPRLPLSAAEAGYVRSLTLPRPRPPAVPVVSRLAVPVPERLLTRARGRLSMAVFTAAAIEEAVSWEIAAALEGRTMTEWALTVVAARSG